MPRGRTLLLVTLVAGGLALRLWWSGAFLDQPEWIDPDNYVIMARALGDGSWWLARYRSPIEPALIILAATVLAGGWQRPTLVATGGVAALPWELGGARIPGGGLHQRQPLAKPTGECENERTFLSSFLSFSCCS
jgi:hypothetical protein